VLYTQLDLECPGRKTVAEVCARNALRVLPLTAVIWYDDRPGVTVK
jgi:hypothetical protein